MRSIAKLFLLASLAIAFSAASLCADTPPQKTGKLSWDLMVLLAADQVQEDLRNMSGRWVDTEPRSALIILDQQVTDSLLLELQDADYEILGSFGQFVYVSAPWSRYLDMDYGIATMDFIIEATAPLSTIQNVARVMPNPATVADVIQAHDLGYLGQGTQIAIINEGFDTENTQLLAFNPSFHLVKQSLDVLGSYETVEGAIGKQSTHGTACALVAAQIVPEAAFYLLSYPDGMGLVGWLCALDYAVRELGVDVVTSSVEFTRPFCHADGTGLLNQTVGNILEDTDSTFLIAAGNWAGGTGTNSAFYAGTYSDEDGDFRHDFTPGAPDPWDRKSLEISAHAGDRITIMLEWDNWDGGLRVQDLDLLLFESQKKTRIASSRGVQFGVEGALAPAEILSVVLPYDGTYCIVIENTGEKWFGAPPSSVSFNLNMLNETSWFSSVECHTPQGSIREVASNPNVISVGSVSPITGEVRTYSSCGVTALDSPKPELYAPDGFANTACKDGFAGTSASAPYAAGAMLLLQSVDPDLSGEQIVMLLQETSKVSMDPCGNSAYSIDIAAALQSLLPQQPEQ